MNHFLDTCVLIANFDRIEGHHKKAKSFIEENDSFIISEYQKNGEIPNLFRRKTNLLKKYIKIISKRASLNLNPNEKKELKRLLMKYSKYDPSIEELKNILTILKQIQYYVMNFIEKEIEKTLPIGKFDEIKKLSKELKIENTPDSIIITYAILEHRKNKLDLITLDKDWDKTKIKKVCNRYGFDIPKVINLKYS